MTRSHMFASCSTPAPRGTGLRVRFSGIPGESRRAFCPDGGPAQRRQSTCVAMPRAISKARFTSLIFSMASSCAARMSGSSPSSMARVSLMNGA